MELGEEDWHSLEQNASFLDFTFRVWEEELAESGSVKLWDGPAQFLMMGTMSQCPISGVVWIEDPPHPSFLSLPSQHT